MTKRKVIAILMLNLMFSNIFQNIFAIQNTNIYCDHDANKYVSYEGRPQKVFDYFYIDENNEKRDAYCINLGMKGAEDYANGYEVSVDTSLNDRVINNIILNGYPYKSVGELGLASRSEAKFATQFAVWMHVSNLNFNQILPLLPEYQRVINAIRNIYDNGIRGGYESGNGVNIVTDGEFGVIDNIDNRYYSKTYSIYRNSNVESILLNCRGANGIIVTDMNNNQVVGNMTYDKIKVLVPRDSVDNMNTISLDFNITAKQTALAFARSSISDAQNVALTVKPIYLENIVKSFKVKNVPTSLVIKKIDKEDGSVIPNTKFKIINVDTNKVMGEYITDNDGKIYIDIVKDFGIYGDVNLKIEEIEVPNKYYIDTSNSSKNIHIVQGNSYEEIFENEKIKGKIKIIKTGSDYNEYNDKEAGALLEGAEFEIYDENGNMVEHLVTDKLGVAISQDLYKGKYYVKEVKSPQHYNITDSTFEINIDEMNKVIELDVKNESMRKVKGKINILKLSLDYNKYNELEANSPLKGTEFDIYDKIGNIVGHLVTDENGIAVSDELYEGIYYIKEVKAPKFYYITDTDYEINISENQNIVNLEIRNKSMEYIKELPKTGF